MKKALLLLSVCVSLAACSSGPDQSASTTKPSAAEAELPVNTPPPPTAATTEKADALDHDSTTASNVSAVARQPQVDTSITKIGTSPTGSPHDKGAKLMASSDCASCHREREKLLGPAYTAIAQKYPATPANVSKLAAKIISGGKGNWGDIAMTPHPGLSKGDAQEMVRYILTLK